MEARSRREKSAQDEEGRPVKVRIQVRRHRAGAHDIFSIARVLVDRTKAGGIFNQSSHPVQHKDEQRDVKQKKRRTQAGISQHQAE